jgi:hypothetical protein
LQPFLVGFLRIASLYFIFLFFIFGKKNEFWGITQNWVMTIVIFNQVYNMGDNADSLKLLSLSSKRKIQYYYEYFSNEYVCQNKKYREGINTCNSRVCVNESTSNEFKGDYYSKLENVSELQYHKA